MLPCLLRMYVVKLYKGNINLKKVSIGESWGKMGRKKSINYFLTIFSPLVKSSATSSLITIVPEVKLFGLSQTKYLRFYTCEVV